MKKSIYISLLLLGLFLSTIKASESNNINDIAELFDTIEMDDGYTTPIEEEPAQTIQATTIPSEIVERTYHKYTIEDRPIPGTNVAIKDDNGTYQLGKIQFYDRANRSIYIKLKNGTKLTKPQYTVYRESQAYLIDMINRRNQRRIKRLGQ